jgi:hypothetical protein
VGGGGSRSKRRGRMEGGGEMGHGRPARVWGSGFVTRWVGELGQGGEYGPLDGDHLTVQACSMG